jgi:hypothetical protein
MLGSLASIPYEHLLCIQSIISSGSMVLGPINISNTTKSGHGWLAKDMLEYVHGQLGLHPHCLR